MALVTASINPITVARTPSKWLCCGNNRFTVNNVSDGPQLAIIHLTTAPKERKQTDCGVLSSEINYMPLAHISGTHQQTALMKPNNAFTR